MDVRAERVTVTGAHGDLLTGTSVRIAAGEVTVVTGEPQDGHTAFALAVTGRIRPSSGSVRPDAATLRARSVLVDAPDITAPEPNLAVADVIAEQLSLAGSDSGKTAVADVLTRHDLDGATRFEHVAPAARVTVLTELAARRANTELVVLDTPDRHGGDPADWWPSVLDQAEQGRAVVVLCHPTTAQRLSVTAARLGELNPSEQS